MNKLEINKNELLNLYNSGLIILEIARVLHKRQETISNILCEIMLDGKPSTVAKRKHKFPRKPYKRKNLLNVQRGELLVIKDLGNKIINGKLHPMWLCKCKCGNEIELEARQINKKKKSCGCLKTDPKAKDILSSSINIRWRHYSKDPNIDFDKNKFCELSQMNCYYCNRAPFITVNALLKDPRKGITKERLASANYTCHGLDRIDSNKSHTLSNVITCCWNCNRAKCAMSPEEFKIWVSEIASHHLYELSVEELHEAVKDYKLKKNIIYSDLEDFDKSLENFDINHIFAEGKSLNLCTTNQEESYIDDNS